MDIVLELQNVSKYFPGVVANEDVNFTLKKSEIHTLLGENGAGKSTLMNIVAGLYRPDKGRIIYNGKEIEFSSPSDALSMGIGMVHQHFRISEKHTVFENIIIGYKNLTIFPNKKKLLAKIKDIMDTFKLFVEPESYMFELSIGDKQKVEIIKTLINNPKIMIFDEPTAVLSSQETETLFEVLRILKDKEYSIIFISHKLDEVMRISDKVTILSRGKLSGSYNTADITREILAERMIGRKILMTISKEKVHYSQNILKLTNASALDNKGLPAVKNLNLEIKKGEIFGIAGVSGNGQVELAEILFGLRSMSYDEFTFCDKPILRPKPKLMMKLGMRLIPSDRKLVGSAIGLNIPENFILNRFKHRYFSYNIFLKNRMIQKRAKDSTDKFDIRHSNFRQSVRDLSGGNLQKVIVAREIDSDPDFLIAVYPTRGLDIGAVEHLQRVLIDEQKKGKTIVLISEEIEEIVALSDRIGVMYNGNIIKVWERGDATLQELGLALGGVI